MSSSLNAARRDARARRGRGPVVDVLVVGLGATGAGAALDAASRGLSVAAIDAHDLAFGTSTVELQDDPRRAPLPGQGPGRAWPTRAPWSAASCCGVPHRTWSGPTRTCCRWPRRSPGARRRSDGRIPARRRAADRRPHAPPPAARPLPVCRRPGAGRSPRLLSASRPARRAAVLGRALVDDARLVVALARTAASRGARILTRCRALELAGDGAQVRDELTGDDFRDPGQDGDQRQRASGRACWTRR